MTNPELLALAFGMLVSLLFFNLLKG